jgi:hypothetical protein
LQPPENFAGGIWASFQQGYVLLARGAETGILPTIPAELPFIESEAVFRQTRPHQPSAIRDAFLAKCNVTQIGNEKQNG